MSRAKENHDELVSAEDAAHPEVNSSVPESGGISPLASASLRRAPALRTGGRAAKAVQSQTQRRTRERARGRAKRAGVLLSNGAAERAARQRARILGAAEHCFIEHGFHAASMADIGAAAGMSPGLIYRYFHGKNQIVQAIIEQHLETDGCPSTDSLHTCEDFCAGLLEKFESWRRRDDPHMNAALMLELTAEAARDPEIMRITRAKDQVVMQKVTAAVQRAAQAEGVRLTPAAAQIRSVVLQCLMEGLACRAVRDPDLSARQLKPLIGKVLAALLT